MLLRTLFEEPLLFVLVALALIICLSIHEFAHAYVASRLGDDTARLLGRVTLNPLAHLDTFGTLFLLFAGFGWGKPVPFNPYNLKNPKRDSALIALAGPVSNFILAIIFTILLRLVIFVISNSSYSSILYGQVASDISLFSSFLSLLITFFVTVIGYNLVLGIFNLIPIHPLDGFKIVNGLLPHNLSEQWIQMAPYGIYFLMLLVFTGGTDLIVRPLLSFSLAILGLGNIF